ncbi:MAG: FtsH protease activity modulator HflK [Desulfovibrionales bacterium]|nr:FtsH protease activity modulator HflK [Desulfovibrionales bacterium]
MNWDWEKLQQKRQKHFPGQGGNQGPDFGEFQEKFNQLKNFKFPGLKFILLGIVILWLLSGIFIVHPDEVGVVQRFGEFNREKGPGLNYHLPFPIEKSQTPKVTEINRVEIGFRTSQTQGRSTSALQSRTVPEESLMLTGDENMLDVQFIVQYQIKDARKYLFNISQPHKTVKDAAEATMREVIGYNNIDAALTDEKLTIQTQSKDLLQDILDTYEAGIRVIAVQLQDVHPPQQVIDSFRDVTSAREDQIRFINEAEAYRNEVLPKARGEAAAVLNRAEAFKEQEIRRADGESTRFLSILQEYKSSPDVTKKRIYLETMQEIFTDPEINKMIISNDALNQAVPYLPLNQMMERKVQTNPGTTGGKQ